MGRLHNCTILSYFTMNTLSTLLNCDRLVSNTFFQTPAFITR